MRLLIRMVSGEEIELETKHDSIEEWIKANFNSNKGYAWFSPCVGDNYALNINNIEMVKVSR